MKLLYEPVAVKRIFSFGSNPGATTGGCVIGNNSEKTNRHIAKSKYPAVIILCSMPRAPVKRENKIYLGGNLYEVDK